MLSYLLLCLLGHASGYSVENGGALLVHEDYGFSAAYDSAEGKIYLAGGMRYPQNLMSYDIASNTFEAGGVQYLSDLNSDLRIASWPQAYAQLGTKMWGLSQNGRTLGSWDVETSVYFEVDVLVDNVCNGGINCNCVAAWEDYVLVIDGSGMTKNVFIYDSSTSEWLQTVLSLGTATRSPGCVVAGDTLFVAGQSVIDEGTSVPIQTFDMTGLSSLIESNATEALTTCGTLTAPASRSRMVFDSDNVYMVGAEYLDKSPSNVNTLTVINRKSCKAEVPSVSIPLFSAGAAVMVDNEIYMFGGARNEESWTDSFYKVSVGSSSEDEGGSAAVVIIIIVVVVVLLALVGGAFLWKRKQAQQLDASSYQEMNVDA